MGGAARESSAPSLEAVREPAGCLNEEVWANEKYAF